MNMKLERAKLNRQIELSGKEYIFYKQGENSFGEPTDEVVELYRKKCIYHEVNSFISKSTGETTSYVNKKQPRLLTMFTDDYVKADKVDVNGRMLNVVGTINVQEYNLSLDICLEE